MENRLFVIKGEDMRNVYLARLLVRDGHSAVLWDNPISYADIPAAEQTRVSVSPCILVLAPSAPQEEVLYSLQHLCQGSICIGGKASEEALSLAENKNIKYFNMMEYEPFPILNSIPTAEGALMVVIQNTPFTLRESKIVILGYGRVGKATAALFQACGCKVTVLCRSPEQLAYARVNGHTALSLSELGSVIRYADVMLNTIPAQMFDKATLEKTNRNGFLVDLASGKNNIDYAAAKELGISAVQASALPGKVAPASAAEHMKDAIFYYINKVEVT